MIFIKSLFLFLMSSVALANFYISPYLQRMTTNSVYVQWESSSKKTQRIYFGETKDRLTRRASVKKIKTRIKWRKPNIYLFQTKLTKLKPNTKYYYQVRNAHGQSKVYEFTTNSPSSNKNFTFLVLSDAQSGYYNTRNVTRYGLMKHTFNEGRRLPSFSLFSGDLVQRGILHFQWKKHFFDPLKPLLARVPIIPVYGNHEYQTKKFKQYFRPPLNSKRKENHNYSTFDYQSVRFVNLNSSAGSRTKRQLKFLRNVLARTEKDRKIKFVIAQFHHPHLSEIWPDGEKKYSRKMVDIFKSFSRRSKKQTVIFTGHAHSYAKGYDHDSRLTFITVGPVGGFLDRWDSESRDYLTIHKTISHHGWVRVDVDGDQMKISRLGSLPRDRNTGKVRVVDQTILNLKQYEVEAPEVYSAKIKGSKLYFKASPLKAIGGKVDHLSSQIRLIYSNGKKIAHINKENIYGGYKKVIDTLSQSSLSLRSYGKNVKAIQLRYRSSNLDWGPWSKSVKVE